MSESARIADVALDRASASVASAYDAVRTRILDGSLPPGAPLSQVRLARDLGISRTPLREALGRLVSEGLLDEDFNHRTRVSELSLDDLDQIYAMRFLLEPMAISATLPQLDAGGRDGLVAAVDGMDEAIAAGDLAAFRECHRAFHLGLTAAAGARIVRSLGELWDHAERYRLAYLHHDYERRDSASSERLRRSQDEHRAILDAALDGDPERTAELLIAHLRRTLEAVFADATRTPVPRAGALALAVTGKPRG